ncbi:MAG TPA: glycosyltransferase family 39 protein [Aquihabitans sp.]|nr:glycosyltransferase family 39 protein [Aquihabitans sp.]
MTGALTTPAEPVAGARAGTAPPRDGEAAWRGSATWWLVVAAAVLGFALRLAWGLWVDHPPQGLYDPSRYVGYGQVIADGRGMVEPLTGEPTAYYPPGYPWFVGIVTWLGSPLTDQVATLVVVVQAVLGAATVVAGAIVARALAGPRAAVVAAVGLAVYPNLVFHAGAVLGETLYNALFLGFCAVLVTARWPEDLRPRRVLAAGALLGLAVMVRPISLAILPVVLLAWWVATRDRRLVLRSGLLLTAAVAACIVPWTVRNAIRMDAFVPISTNTGENLCMGHAPGATGAFSPRAACDTGRSLLDGPTGEVEADQEKVRIGIRGALDAPGEQPGLLWKRFFYTWVRDGDHDGVIAVQSYRSDPFIDQDVERRLIRAADLTYWLVCAAGVAGAVALLWRRRGTDVLVVGAALATAAVPLAFFGDSRFKVPVIPLLIVIGATLVGGSWRRGDAAAA